MKLRSLDRAIGPPSEWRLAAALVEVTEVELTVTRREPISVDVGAALLLDTIGLGDEPGISLEELGVLTGLPPRIVEAAVAELSARKLVTVNGSQVQISPGLNRDASGVTIEVDRLERVLLIGRPVGPLQSRRTRIPSLKAVGEVAAVCPSNDELVQIAKELWGGESLVRTTIARQGPSRILAASAPPDASWVEFSDGDATERLELPRHHVERSRLAGVAERMRSALPTLFEPWGRLEEKDGGVFWLHVTQPQWRDWTKGRGAFQTTAVVEDAPSGAAIEFSVSARPASDAAARAMFVDAVLAALESVADGPAAKAHEVVRALRAEAPWNSYSKLSLTTEELLDAAWERRRFRVSYWLAREEDGL